MLTMMVRTRACRPPLAARAVALLGEYRGECPLLLELLAAFAAQAPGATTAAQTAKAGRQFRRLSGLFKVFHERGGSSAHLLMAQERRPKDGLTVEPFAVGGFRVAYAAQRDGSLREATVALMVAALTLLGWQSPQMQLQRARQKTREAREAKTAATKETQRQRRLARFKTKHGW